jgi:hypothetical protein
VNYINNYILRDNKINVLVVWNGSSDRNILKRLVITQFPLLNITCYDKLFNKEFVIQLEKVETKQILNISEVAQSDNIGQIHTILYEYDIDTKKINVLVDTTT